MPFLKRIYNCDLTKHPHTLKNYTWRKLLNFSCPLFLQLMFLLFEYSPMHSLWLLAHMFSLFIFTLIIVISWHRLNFSSKEVNVLELIISHLWGWGIIFILFVRKLRHRDLKSHETFLVKPHTNLSPLAPSLVCFIRPESPCYCGNWIDNFSEST